MNDKLDDLELDDLFEDDDLNLNDEDFDDLIDSSLEELEEGDTEYEVNIPVDLNIEELFEDDGDETNVLTPKGESKKNKLNIDKKEDPLEVFKKKQSLLKNSTKNLIKKNRSSSEQILDDVINDSEKNDEENNKTSHTLISKIKESFQKYAEEKQITTIVLIIFGILIVLMLLKPTGQVKKKGNEHNNIINQQLEDNEHMFIEPNDKASDFFNTDIINKQKKTNEQTNTVKKKINDKELSKLYNFIEFTNTIFLEVNTIVQKENEVIVNLYQKEVNKKDANKFLDKAIIKKTNLLKEVENYNSDLIFSDMKKSVEKRIRGSINNTKELKHSISINLKGDEIYKLIAKNNRSEEKNVNLVQENLLDIFELYNIEYYMDNGIVKFKKN